VESPVLPNRCIRGRGKWKKERRRERQRDRRTERLSAILVSCWWGIANVCLWGRGWTDWETKETANTHYASYLRRISWPNNLFLSLADYSLFKKNMYRILHVLAWNLNADFRIVFIFSTAIEKKPAVRIFHKDSFDDSVIQVI